MEVVDKKKALVPVLRFSDYTEPLKRVELKSLIEEGRKIRYGIVQPGKYDPNGRFMIRGQDYSEVKGWGDINDFFRVSDIVEAKYKKARVKGGDLLITIVGAGTGWFEEVPQFLTGANITQTTGRVAVDKEKAAPIFVKNYFESTYGKKEISKYIKGQAQPGLNIGDVEIFKLTLPTLPEQQKIAAFLSAVDEKIQQLTKKKALLEQYKKGVMQKLFPKKAGQAPELRFKKPDGSNYPDWEEKKLGEVIDFYNGKGHEQSVVEDGQFTIVNSKFISTEGRVQKFCNEQIFPLIKGDLVMVMSDIPNGKALAKCYIIEKDETYSLNQRICCLRKKEAVQEFLFYIVSRNKYYLAFDSGVGQTNLKKAEVLNCPLNIPSKEEQQKIADFLSGIDQKINQVETQINQTQTFKKGLLQQMFV